MRTASSSSAPDQALGPTEHVGSSNEGPASGDTSSVQDHRQLSDYSVVVVYGDSYNDPKAEALSKRLMQLGHEDVHTLRGGFQAWTDAGHETEPGE